MGIEVKSRFGVHSGGTKFYQIYTITKAGQREAIQINHYGSYNAGSRHAPINVGQTTLAARTNDNAEWEADRTRASKAKPHGSDRGFYRFDPVQTKVYEREDDFVDFVREEFDRKNADKIIAAFCTGSADESSAAEIDRLFKRPEPLLAAKATEPEVRPEAWGSW